MRMKIDHNIEGITEAWALDGHGGGRKLAGTEAAPQGQETQGWEWLHLNYSEPSVQDWMSVHSGLSDLTVEALLQQETRPRCVVADQGLMLFLRGVNLNPGSDPDDMVSIRIWLDAQRVISLGMRHLLSIDDVVSAIKRGSAPRSPGEFIAMFLNALLDRASKVIDDLATIVDELDDSVLEVSSEDQRATLLEIRRQVITLRRFLAPQREALNRLIGERTTVLTDENRLHIREEADRLTRFIEDLDEARERTSVIHESLVSRLAELTNKRMYVLSVIAAIFLPLSFVTGLLGINVGGIPGAESPSGFLIVLIIMAVIAGGLWAYFRWRRWF